MVNITFDENKSLMEGGGSVQAAGVYPHQPYISYQPDAGVRTGQAGGGGSDRCGRDGGRTYSGRGLSCGSRQRRKKT